MQKQQEVFIPFKGGGIKEFLCAFIEIPFFSQECFLS